MRNRLLSLTLVLALAFALCAPAFADYYTDLLPAVRTLSPDYAGKTIILHSNDVHGQIDGYAYMPALKQRFLDAGASEVLLVDVGDFSQGDTYVSVSKGQAAVEMMNAAGYDYVALGNHDFDYGYEQLMQNLKGAKFKTLCADIRLDETGELILPAADIHETASGLKLGFIGVDTPETATKVHPDKISQITFSAFDKLYSDAQAAVDSIRDESDLVIALTHLGVNAEAAVNGYRSVDLLDKVTGIDFTIDGHSHTVMTSAEDGKAVQSTGTKFAYIGVVVIDDASRTVEDHYLLPTAALSKDADVAARAQEIMDAVDALYGEPFAITEVLLDGERADNRTGETNMGDLVADAMVWSVIGEGGTEQLEPNHVIGITNGGGIRASIEPGEISMKSVNTVLPFGNTVAVIYVTGEELLEVLEASTFCTPEQIGGYPQTSGIEWTVDTTVPYDQGAVYTLNGKETAYYAPASIRRVTITAVNGEPFDPAATYAVVTNDFCAAGGDTYNAFQRAYAAGTGFDTSIPMDMVLISYITSVLDGYVTAELYGQPRGSQTQILADAGEEAVAPAA